MSERVDNRALAVEFERRVDLGWITADQVATRLGWSHGGHPDGSRVMRQLGLRSSGGPMQKTIEHDRAIEMCHAIGCIPFEVGL